MDKKKIYLVCLLILPVIFVCGFPLGIAEEAFRLLVNEVRSLEVKSPQRVVVSDPAVIDINVVSDKEILVIGKSPGTTRILLWEGDLQREVPIEVFRRDPQEVINELNVLIQGAKIKGITLKEESGKVVATGELVNQEDFQRLQGLLAGYEVINLVRFKEDRPLVEVNVQVLEISATLYKTLGFTWPSSYSVTGYPAGYTLGCGTAASGPVAKRITDAAGIVGWSAAGQTFTSQFDFSTTETKTKVLSRPHLVTLSGKEASVLVGGEVPIVEITKEEGDIQENITYKEYGIKLNILPTVFGKDEVKIHIAAEVSDIASAGGYTRSTALGGGTIPAFTTRTTETELYLKSGESVIIGGLIKQKDAETLNQVPWLSKIPVLGEFFKKRTISSSAPQEDTELVITITPVVRRIKEAEESDILEAWEEKKLNNELPPSLMKASPQLFNYTVKVQERLYEGIYYPYAARQAKIEGLVKLSLHLLSNGDLLDVIIRESSGYKVLDNAAIDTARSQAPYSPFPQGVKLKELWVDIPIVYRFSN